MILHGLVEVLGTHLEELSALNDVETCGTQHLPVGSHLVQLIYCMNKITKNPFQAGLGQWKLMSLAFPMFVQRLGSKGAAELHQPQCETQLAKLCKSPMWWVLEQFESY